MNLNYYKIILLAIFLQPYLAELMDLEHKYLDALAHVTSFSLLAGKLALNWGKDEN